jgi:hypothetical protein
MFDVNEVAALFHIHKAASEHGSALTNIRDVAWQALQRINEEHIHPATATPAPEPVVDEGPGVEEEPIDDGRRV